MKKYPLKRGAILNILNKRCWRQATKDLPDITDLMENNYAAHSKLSKSQVVKLIAEYEDWTGSMRSFCMTKIGTLNVSEHCLYQALTGRRRL